jgi:C4-type Zn-finger protein
MLVKLFKCQICGFRFEVKVLDRTDPHERDIPGSPICCDECGSPRVEPVRTIRNAG